MSGKNYVVMMRAPETVGGYTFVRFEANKTAKIPPGCSLWKYSEWEEWHKSNIAPYHMQGAR